MEVTELRVFPKEGPDKKLKAYVTVTFDHSFVVRNIKVIQGSNGLFIAMPSRKAKNPCPKCGYKNEIGSQYCSSCGAKAGQDRAPESATVDAKNDHRDIAHPITQQFRDYLQSQVLAAYDKEILKQTGSSANG